MQTRDQFSHDVLLTSFLTHVNETPGKIAVAAPGIEISFKTLNDNTNKLANLLLRDYPGLFNASNQPPMVGVYCHNKMHALYCELALLKLGAVFVPFSSNDPKERQQFMIDKTHTSLMLTDDQDKTNTSSLDYCYIQTAFDKNADAELSSDDVSPLFKLDDQSLAYVLFTSGSTAKNPKGVLRTRSGLFNQMTRDYKTDLNITDQDVFLNLATFTHDQAIVDCFGALLNGCTLCLYNPNNISIDDLHQFIKVKKVSIFSSIPSMFSIIFENIKDRNTFPDLKVVTIGGEETKISHCELFQKTCPETSSLINGYGATEISWVSSYTITHQTNLKELSVIPLGYPTEFATCELVKVEDGDAEQEEMYELCIHSDSLAPRYLDDDAATTQAFFEQGGKRYYRTGDIVKLDEAGCVHFVGRKAWHEKIHGKRVNLHEVEHALKLAGYGDDCIVMAYGEGPKRKLYAFHTQNPNVDFNRIIKLEKKPEHVEPGTIAIVPTRETSPYFPPFISYWTSMSGELHSISINREKTLCQTLTEIKIESDNRELISLLLTHYGNSFQKTALNSSMKWLKTLLPNYMMPDEFIGLAELPLLPNSKVNRRALLKQLEELDAAANRDFDKIQELQQSDDIKAAIEGFWREILSIPTSICFPSDPFATLGGTSILAIQLTGKINHYLADKHDLPPIASGQWLFTKETSTLSKFTKRLNELIKLIKDQDKVIYHYNPPQFNERPLDQQISDADGLLRNESRKVLSFNYAALTLIAKHYAEKYGITILIGDTYQNAIQHVKDFISNMDDNVQQVGLVLFNTADKESHPIGTILCKDYRNSKIVLLVSDSRPGSPAIASATSVNGILTCIAKEIPEIEVQFDLSGRQNDVKSCTTLTLLYLKEALRCNMLDEIIYLSKDHDDYEWDMGEFSYRSFLCFVSPPECFKASTIVIRPEVDQDRVLKTDKHGRTLRQYLVDHSHEDSFKSGKKRTQNIVAFEKPDTFRDIVMKKYESEIYPTLYHFSIRFMNYEGKIQQKEMHLIPTFLEGEKTLGDLMKCIYAILPTAKPDNIKGLVIDGQLFDDPSVLIQALPQGKPIDIVIVSHLDLKSELHLLCDYVEKFTESRKGNRFTLFASEKTNLSLAEIAKNCITNPESTEFDIALSLGWINKDGSLLTTNPHLRTAYKDAVSLKLQSSQFCTF